MEMQEADGHGSFNRSFLVSTNSLWKFERGEFKANIDYSFNRVTADASNITTYFLTDLGLSGRDESRPYGGNHIITENRSGTEHTHSLSGKFVYELNQRTAFINNTLQTNIDWDDVTLATTGGRRYEDVSRRDNTLTPDISVGFAFNEDSQISLGYKMATVKPPYSQLTGSLHYVGIHEREGGNPAMHDERMYNLQLFGMRNGFMLYGTFTGLMCCGGIGGGWLVVKYQHLLIFLKGDGFLLV